MSTLGDLLAEHTVLPGNAVDHLHAVVGEWQLLADLSFADYLMWVRRDDAGIAASAGYELSADGRHALVRSTAVRPDLRGRGAGLAAARFAVGIWIGTNRCRAGSTCFSATRREPS